MATDQNYFRDFDPAVGHFVESDPTGRWRKYLPDTFDVFRLDFTGINGRGQ